MTNMKKSIKILVSLLCVTMPLQFVAQETLTLEKIHNTLLDNSRSITQAKNNKALAIESNKFFKARLKPQLSIQASLPNYTKTSTPIIQPDGTIAFQSIRQANSRISAMLTQVIPATGGSIFAITDLQRFDNLSQETKQYNGIPIRLGISQPIFGFNTWKYQKNIERLRIESAELSFNTALENAYQISTNLFFDLIIAQENLATAKNNQSVNEKLLLITTKRLELGEVSNDEKLQLEIELNNAKLAASNAGYNVNFAINALNNFIGSNYQNDKIKAEVPTEFLVNTINHKTLFETYKKNRNQIIENNILIEQNKADANRIKSELGFNANINASIGLSRGSDQIQNIYNDPFDEQQFNLTLQIPIVDWGMKKSALEINAIERKEINENHNQILLEVERSIHNNLNLLIHAQSEIILLKEIAEKAKQRFEISNERYILGNIDITNLTLAQRENDIAKNNYISALKQFWDGYFNLRRITGFDIITNKEIKY